MVGLEFGNAALYFIVTFVAAALAFGLVLKIWGRAIVREMKEPTEITVTTDNMDDKSRAAVLDVIRFAQEHPERFR